MRRLLIEHKDKLNAESNIARVSLLKEFSKNFLKKNLTFKTSETAEIMEELCRMGVLLGQFTNDIDFQIPQGSGLEILTLNRIFRFQECQRNKYFCDFLLNFVKLSLVKNLLR